MRLDKQYSTFVSIFWDRAILTSKYFSFYTFWLYFLTAGVGVYIGLSDRVSEGDWRWVDGSGLTYDKFFRPGQPNDWDGSYPGQGADCAGSNDSGWFDDYCGKGTRFIYERPTWSLRHNLLTYVITYINKTGLLQPLR